MNPESFRGPQLLFRLYNMTPIQRLEDQGIRVNFKIEKMNPKIIDITSL